MGDYVHGGQISDIFYRFSLRSQEYTEGTLKSGQPARDDGYLQKFGFRFDKELTPDLNLFVAAGETTRRLEHVLVSQSITLQCGAIIWFYSSEIKDGLGILMVTIYPIPLSMAEQLVQGYSLPTYHSASQQLQCSRLARLWFR